MVSATRERSRTVGDVIRELFPRGTTGSAGKPLAKHEWPDCPRHPADLFAAAALLLERAGVYQFMEFQGSDADGSRRDIWPHPIIPMSQEENTHLIDIACEWAYVDKVKFDLQPLRSPPPFPVEALWVELGEAQNSPVFEPIVMRGSEPAEWWLKAAQLLIIADEAAEGIGFDYIDPDTLATTGHMNRRMPKDKYNKFVWFWQFSLSLRLPSGKGAFHSHFETVATLAPCADVDIVSVQPKMHTASVGSALRSFSHNLALLPPRGVVRTVWHRPLSPLPSELEASLNLLLIPYPYNLKAKWFKGRTSQKTTPDLQGWGWLELSNENWLYGENCADEIERDKRREVIWQFVDSLIAEAKTDVDCIHGVVLPEDALDFSTFEYICKKIFDKYRGMLFFISGSSSNCQGDKGTCVVTASVTDLSGSHRKSVVTSRQKHHRWRLDRSQIVTYGLSSALEPSITYWEDIGLPNREVHIHVFRNASTLTAMLCEDLARVDPCHTVIRSVGPNLVLVLLMDGPQIAQRWPARYATVLAEDPGSSVLTLTSLGLINRANEVGLHEKKSRSIGLFRDDQSNPIEIVCPENCHASIVMLHGVPSWENTLDGRHNRDAISYRYGGQRAIACPNRDLVKAIFNAAPDGSAS